MFKKNYTGFNRAEFFSPYQHSPRQAAFTLAEVLITLSVIGVVAALTLPTLMQNYQKQVAINRLKHAYSVISNTLKRAEADYGNITEWGLTENSWKEYETNSVLSDIQAFAENTCGLTWLGQNTNFAQ